LWRLRRAGIDVLLADKWSLALRPDVAVDAHLMDQWATRLIDGTASTADLAVPPCWAEVLEFLPGWYDDWVLVERERLRQRMLHGLEELSRRLASAGRFADAVEAAIVAIGAEPLRESAQRVLIEAHVAEGNLSEARRSWQEYRDLVHRELGLDPSGAPFLDASGAIARSGTVGHHDGAGLGRGVRGEPARALGHRPAAAGFRATRGSGPAGRPGT